MAIIGDNTELDGLGEIWEQSVQLLLSFSADEKHLADQSYQYLTTGDDIGGLHEEHGGDIGIVQGKVGA